MAWKSLLGWKWFADPLRLCNRVIYARDWLSIAFLAVNKDIQEEAAQVFFWYKCVASALRRALGGRNERIFGGGKSCRLLQK